MWERAPRRLCTQAIEQTEARFLLVGVCSQYCARLHLGLGNTLEVEERSVSMPVLELNTDFKREKGVRHDATHLQSQLLGKWR
jgi:hypothetical protein